MIVLWTKTPGLHKTQSSFILETKAMDHWPNKWKIFISIIFWSPQSSNASLRLHLLLQCNLIISKKKKWILSRASRNEVNKKINEQVHITKWGQGEKRQLEIHQNVILYVSASPSLPIQLDVSSLQASLPLTL